MNKKEEKAVNKAKLRSAEKKLKEFYEEFVVDTEYVFIGGVMRTFLNGRQFEVGSVELVKASPKAIEEAKEALGKKVEVVSKGGLT